MKLRVLIGSTLAVALLGLGILAGGLLGPGHAFAQTPPAKGTAPSGQTPPTAAITQQQAETAALAASPGNTVAHTHLLSQNGSAVYDVDFANGGGALVDGTTGKVIQSEAAGQDHGGRGPGGFGGADQAALAAQAKVTQAQAEKTALAASPGATVDHTRLFSQNGTVVYDVDFSNGGGATVNAVTGAIIAGEAAGSDHGGMRGGPNGGPPANQP